MSSSRLGWAVLILAGALVLGVGLRRAQDAARAVERAEVQLEEQRIKAEEVRSLRGLQERVASRERPPQDVIAQINRTLGEVGVRSDRLRGLEPVSDLAVPGAAGGSSRYKRQTVAVTLEGLDPREVGRFFGAWRRSQPAWTPTRVELYHLRNQPPPSSLYGLRFEMASTYLSDEPPPRQSP